MNKFALVTVARIPGQGSGPSAFRAPEVNKAPEKPQVFLTFQPKFETFEAWEAAQHEKKLADYLPRDDYADFKAAYAAFGGKVLELYVDDEWHPWYGDKMPSFNMPPENYRIKEGY